MDPSLLIPKPDAIPVPWGWFYILLMLTFVLHLLFMNAMLGCSLIALVKSFRGSDTADPTEKDISRKLPYLIAFTVNMGVAPLLFIQVLYGNLIYTSSILMAWYWLSVVLLLILAYYSAYIYGFKFDTLKNLRRVFIGVAVVFMLIIAFIFSNNMTLMLTPGKWAAYLLNPRGTLLNLSEPILWPRYFHFVNASVAVGSLFLALQAEKKNPEKVPVHLRRFVYATLIQIGIGIWFLSSLPLETLLLFMGESIFANLAFLSGLIGALLSIFLALRNRARPAAAATLFTIVAMVFMRDVVRRAYLEPWFKVSQLTVIPQYTPLILFLTAFAAGILVVGYMLLLAHKAGKGAAK